MMSLFEQHCFLIFNARVFFSTSVGLHNFFYHRSFNYWISIRSSVPTSATANTFHRSNGFFHVRLNKSISATWAALERVLPNDNNHGQFLPVNKRNTAPIFTQLLRLRTHVISFIGMRYFVRQFCRCQKVSVINPRLCYGQRMCIEWE